MVAPATKGRGVCCDLRRRLLQWAAVAATNRAPPCYEEADEVGGDATTPAAVLQAQNDSAACEAQWYYRRRRWCYKPRTTVLHASRSATVGAGAGVSVPGGSAAGASNCA
jgi:hypothetical protein